MVRRERAETLLVVVTGAAAFLTLALVAVGYLLLTGRIGP